MEILAETDVLTAQKPAAAPRRPAFPAAPITPEEAESRRAAVETARGLLAIEGLCVSPEAEVDDAAWVRGELTMEEKIERTRARARRLAGQVA